MTEHERFLVLTADNGGYVQCMFHDNDTGIYCESSSGFYQMPKPKLSRKQRKAIAAQGFSMNGKQGNFTLDVPMNGEGTLWNIAGLMLETLYRGYGSEHFTMNAPLADANLEFHRPESDPEQAVSEILKLNASTMHSAPLYDYLTGYKASADDKYYATLFTKALRNSIIKANHAALDENCGGKYIEGEMCGLDVILSIALMTSVMCTYSVPKKKPTTKRLSPINGLTITMSLQPINYAK